LAGATSWVNWQNKNDLKSSVLDPFYTLVSREHPLVRDFAGGPAKSVGDQSLAKDGIGATVLSAG